MEAVPCDPLRSGDLALTQRWLPFSHLVFDLLPICVLHIDTQCPDRQHKASHRSQAVQAVRILQDRNRGLGTSWAVR
ncbi:hypothetical protein chiPu_0031844 [Chiloscyllium punctatum]|uniref:Uncharacterized protein n=1 Tax=Chiloscyllium punctatum TaxID=137246 RepID=A0A401TYZ4_CHIPU|nr:hypothetical protein [Chiloscyllium punctatum]